MQYIFAVTSALPGTYFCSIHLRSFISVLFSPSLSFSLYLCCFSPYLPCLAPISLSFTQQIHATSLLCVFLERERELTYLSIYLYSFLSRTFSLSLSAYYFSLYLSLSHNKFTQPPCCVCVCVFRERESQRTYLSISITFSTLHSLSLYP